MIIGFDFDGTLVRSWTATPLPGVILRLAELPPDTATFIATNQAGPVWRAVTGDAKYPTVEDVAQRLSGGLLALGWRPSALLIAVHPGKDGGEWDDAANVVNRQLMPLLRGFARIQQVSAWPEQRKPWPGMLTAARQLLVAPQMYDILYIGDMETDAQAARAAQCRYLDAALWRSEGLP